MRAGMARRLAIVRLSQAGADGYQKVSAYSGSVWFLNDTVTG